LSSATYSSRAPIITPGAAASFTFAVMRSMLSHISSIPILSYLISDTFMFCSFIRLSDSYSAAFVHTPFPPGLILLKITVFSFSEIFPTLYPYSNNSFL